MKDGEWQTIYVSDQPMGDCKVIRFPVRYKSNKLPEQMAHYKKLHAAVWPAVQKTITACNIQNYSIYLKEIDGKQYLFSYFEYTGNDFEKDMKQMAADSTTQRWWKETAPTQLPLPDAASKGETWSAMEEVFHQN
ncbi:MAG: L-rhamnose mutarotase [Acinetobacter sp.]|nr:MAG: L-rhamnose mutarotase [Acinetobacter sp.]